DFARLVALDAARARVPARDDAFRAEHVDRIVLDAVHQQPEAFLAFAQHLVVPLALAEIARDLREAEQDPLVVAQRGDHDVGPEARSVLAQPPALVFDAALLHRLAQLLRGPIALDVLGRVENRKVLADDLLRAVLLDQRRTGVPARDMAVLVENEDRVIPHA